jgi:hypothetical protein
MVGDWDYRILDVSVLAGEANGEWQEGVHGHRRSWKEV